MGLTTVQRYCAACDNVHLEEASAQRIIRLFISADNEFLLTVIVMHIMIMTTYLIEI